MAGVKTLTCRQCDGEMVRTKVQSLGGCLGVLGKFFAVVGLLAALIGGFMTWAGSKATVDTIGDVDKSAYEAALEDLEDIEGGPWTFTQEFRERKRISPETLRDIPEPPRNRVKAILDAHDLNVAAGSTGAMIGGGMAAGLGTFLFIGGLLGLVLGLLLNLKRKVWRCRACGTVVARG